MHLLKTRRSVPAAFLGEPGPDGTQLRDILSVGARVPDHGKLAPWRFLVIEGAAARAAAGASVADLYRRNNPDDTTDKGQQIGDRFVVCPLTIIVVSRVAPHPKIPEWEQFLSAGAVSMNVVHAAHALGFAAHWVTGWAAGDADVRRLLGVVDGEQVVAIIHIGTPQIAPTERTRPDIDAIVTRWTPQ
ncbi:MAG: nitroreductase family protein [Alphaproteobacteria bacterium]